MDRGEGILQANEQHAQCSETHRRMWKACLLGQACGLSVTPLRSRTPQIKLPKPYLLQGEGPGLPAAQHAPPTISCPPPREVAPSSDRQPLSWGHLSGTPAYLYPPLAWPGVAHSPPHCRPPWPPECTGSRVSLALGVESQTRKGGGWGVGEEPTGKCGEKTEGLA